MRIKRCECRQLGSAFDNMRMGQVSSTWGCRRLAEGTHARLKL
jgi:hypothetical protein